MRPRMEQGDYVFGVSPSVTRPRRIVFAARIAEPITFAEAYRRFPKLRGPTGPIHVRPVKKSAAFPRCSYEHIPNSMHKKDWEHDLASPKLDRFFVCSPGDGIVGVWLGERGPEVDDQILGFFKTCSVHGVSGCLDRRNKDATLQCPIAHRGPNALLYRGLHLETDEPEDLLALCRARTEAARGPLQTTARLRFSEESIPTCKTCRRANACPPKGAVLTDRRGKTCRHASVCPPDE